VLPLLPHCTQEQIPCLAPHVLRTNLETFAGRHGTCVPECVNIAFFYYPVHSVTDRRRVERIALAASTPVCKHEMRVMLSCCACSTGLKWSTNARPTPIRLVCFCTREVPKYDDPKIPDAVAVSFTYARPSRHDSQGDSLLLRPLLLLLLLRAAAQPACVEQEYV